jgi:nitrite reductase/ring-hydroxylating ferredoxin subunit
MGELTAPNQNAKLIELQDCQEHLRSTFTMTEEFVKVASISEIPPDKMKLVQYKDQPVCVANSKGKYYAIRNTCTHLGGPLAQGKLEDQTVECPWHGSRFDLTTGEVKRGPAQIPEKVYEVKIEGSSILVRPK